MRTCFERDGVTLFHGDCREVLREMADASVDSCVTDPPYDLTAGKRGGTGEASVNPNSPAGRSRIGTGNGGGFMGLGWDATGIAFDPGLWREVLRVLKPGGHLLAFGGTRTYHRMACAIEDAGFEIRDSLHWIYGTGFPKSLNCGDGRGTALKPAHEPIVMARKPLVGTVAANVLAFGTGAINVDASRIAGSKPTTGRGAGGVNGRYSPIGEPGVVERIEDDGKGRWPANVLFAHLPDCTDEECAPGCAVAELDRQSGTSKSAGGRIGKKVQSTVDNVPAGQFTKGDPGFGDSGGASRFFYVAKPSRSERDAGCEHLPARTGGEATGREDGSAGLGPRAGAGRTGGARNIHPTVKPIDLMRYLVRLVTPPGGLVLDPFTGSGTTACAAVLEGFRFVGSEMTADYLPIIEARVTHWAAQRDGQLDLFGGVA